MSCEQHLQYAIDGLKEQSELLAEKLKRLRRDYAIAADTLIRFQLEKQIEQTEAEKKKLDQQLDDLEQTSSSQRVYHALLKLGYFLEPVIVPRRVNRTELLLLIDRDGSMIPFHSLSQRLVETALRGGRLGRSNIYYFHNCPVEYLYQDPNHQQAELIENVLVQLRQERFDWCDSKGRFSRHLAYTLRRSYLERANARSVSTSADGQPNPQCCPGWAVVAAGLVTMG